MLRATQILTRLSRLCTICQSASQRLRLARRIPRKDLVNLRLQETAATDPRSSKMPTRTTMTMVTSGLSRARDLVLTPPRTVESRTLDTILKDRLTPVFAHHLWRRVRQGVWQEALGLLRAETHSPSTLAASEVLQQAILALLRSR